VSRISVEINECWLDGVERILKWKIFLQIECVL